MRILFCVLAAAGLALAADPTRIAFIGPHGGVVEVLKRSEQDLDVRIDAPTDEEIAARKTDLSAYRIVLLQHLRTEDRDALRDLLRSAKEKNPALHVLTLSGSGLDLGPGLVEEDKELSAYYDASTENLRRMLVYALVKYAGRDLHVEPRAEDPMSGLYHPDHAGLFPGVAEFLAWGRARGLDVDHLPRAVVTVHAMHLAFQQPRVVDALVHRLEGEGVLAVAAIDFGPAYEKLLLEFAPGVVIHTCHSPDHLPFRERLNVPHLHSLFFREQSIDDWQASGKGMEPGEFLFQVATQECLGAIEPQVGAGTERGGGGAEAFAPIEERIDHLVRRAAAWLRLRAKPNSEKHVAIVYYDREMGKGELMRGSASGMFLNAPRSLMKVLARMKEAGYAISPMPSNEDELLSWMQDRGRIVGVWAPEELARIVREGNPVLVPPTTYAAWLHSRVPPAPLAALIGKWGAPPGQFMTREEQIVIPRIDLGNVVLLPQPLRGEANDPNASVHDHLPPPPHNYLATYFWLEEGFHADAVIHFGTHGSELALPGKNVGLSEADWPDIVLGSMPNINPWILNNLGEALPAKRRAYAVLVGHLPPPIVNAGLSDELANLHDDLDKWEALEAGALKEKFRSSITEQARKARLDQDLKVDLAAGKASLGGGRLLADEEMERLAAYLHRVQDETTPISLHVLGEPPAADQLVPYLVNCLRKGFLEELARALPVPKEEDRLPGDRQAWLRKKAEEVVRLVVEEGLVPADALRAAGGSGATPEGVEKGLKLAIDLRERFRETPKEIDSILEALAGKFVTPGPGNDPTRNPGSVPTGRNLYVLNPEEVPSRPSWEIGKELIDRMLKDRLARDGRYPGKVGFDLNSFATFADYGVMESQILYLIGVEPAWDEKNVVSDVRVIPREALGRPRIDVFISALGYYRDNLPSRMALLDKAVRLVAGLDEDGNGVRERSRAIERKLVDRGLPQERAALLATARVFGYADGQYGSPAYYYLVERSGDWDTREQLMEAYLAQVENVYTQGMWGQPAKEAYEESIQGTEVVMRTWADPSRSPLANKYMWYTGGSLALAVKHLTGKEPEFLLSDVRDPDGTEVVTAEEALTREFRVRLFNRKWIEGMKNEGYAGADQVAVMVGNAMGWAIMREGSVSDETWREIKEVYLDDKLGLGLPRWFEKENPFALQEVLEVLLESARKGYWKADARTLGAVAAAYAASVARHGEGGGLRGGGNAKLEAYVRKAIPAPDSGVPRKADGAKPSAKVTGKRLVPVAPAEASSPWLTLPVGIAAVSLLLLVYGFARKRRT